MYMNFTMGHWTKHGQYKVTWANRSTMLCGIVEPSTTNNSLLEGHRVASSIGHFRPHFFFWWGLKCPRGRDTRPHSIPILFSSLLWNTSLVVASSHLSPVWTGHFCRHLFLGGDKNVHDFTMGPWTKKGQNKLTWANRPTIFGGIVELITTNNSLLGRSWESLLHCTFLSPLFDLATKMYTW